MQLTSSRVIWKHAPKPREKQTWENYKVEKFCGGVERVGVGECFKLHKKQGLEVTKQFASRDSQSGEIWIYDKDTIVLSDKVE